VDLAPLRLPHERAVPLGLVVNELVTNALKHAYPEDAGGVVRVTFAVTPEGEGALFVCDDGIGMGPPREGSLGTDLVTRLVEQIGGQLEQMRQERGTGFCVRFPLVT
jgi:two-component system, sensor histidine kinase PdtaS